MACILDCRSITVPAFAENEVQVNLTPKEVNDLILFGRVTECTTGTPTVGAIVKAFVCIAGEEVPITHTFSGCNGEYLINVPETFNRPDTGAQVTIPPGATIIVKASCTTLPPTPCNPCTGTTSCTCPVG